MILKLFCADLSMRRPGFAMLNYDGDTRSVSIERVSHVDNKKSGMTHGQMLRLTANEIRNYINDSPDLYVRQQAIGGGNPVKTLVALAKVVGVSDYLAELFTGKQYEQVFPTTIKKLITGDCNAKKDVVAKSLERWVGLYDYSVDDESDAVAVGIAWLIKNGYVDGLPDEEKTLKIRSKKK